MDPSVQQQVMNLQNQLAVQVYAALALAVSLGLLALLPIFLALRWNRVAAGVVAAVGFVMFWIPSAPTLYCCPLMFFGGIGTVVFLSLKKPAVARAT